jgi:peptidoglycan/LPS O-acetylase OafA/YrhL
VKKEFQVSHANSFDALRLFAAAQVVFVHALAHLKITELRRPGLSDVMAMFPGVPVFFAISGYLITLSGTVNLVTATALR